MVVFLMVYFSLFTSTWHIVLPFFFLAYNIVTISLYFPAIKTRAIKIIDACHDYMAVESCCSLALSSAVDPDSNKNLRKNILNLENSLIDAVVGDLSCGMCYMATFLVNDK